MNRNETWIVVWDSYLVFRNFCYCIFKLASMLLANWRLQCTHARSNMCVRALFIIIIITRMWWCFLQFLDVELEIQKSYPCYQTFDIVCSIRKWPLMKWLLTVSKSLLLWRVDARGRFRIHSPILCVTFSTDTEWTGDTMSLSTPLLVPACWVFLSSDPRDGCIHADGDGWAIWSLYVDFWEVYYP